ncbi:glycoside hydrolase family 15 protein [Mixia osmundae IAM 14324]|uniref:glucan 1,4-alpha-glucosidase n=1 Tax=Mixia osmundae (strain CBS 9802 / IAM 14324 / JCM 22182 / KY 12970) TaxID=764103 RepID=G7E5D2_MIXOS|nr:glycoside hydrolase family 15 protein [Mixia osmundae IAM 14324]KEI40806.1 glycoside hydrolase family 15 protein [Mixia osmundae IAM 14324]GAA98042.1 hypothetical protein E5Q_04723 [Mixia osmundae IAM 14324]
MSDSKVDDVVVVQPVTVPRKRSVPPLQWLALAFLAVAVSLQTLRNSLTRSSPNSDSGSGSDVFKNSRDTSLDAWVNKQAETSWKGLLDNFNREGTDAGCMVASPSTELPDYWYQWTRDTALVLKSVVQRWIETDPAASGRDLPASREWSRLELLIRRVADEQIKMQHEQTPSGGFATGGLGEVKFHVNGSAFAGPWGRPQRDGPALRATVMTAVAHHLLNRPVHNNSNSGLDVDYVKEKLYDGKFPSQSLIKADLEYVAHYWQSVGFDLWEEVKGAHFFTLLVSQRALRDGAGLAERLGDAKACRFYCEQAQKLEKKLAQFWYPDKRYLLASLDWASDHGKHSWLDIANILAVNHAPSSSYPIRSDRIMSTHYLVTESFRSIYKINAPDLLQPPSGKVRGLAIGRYPEDVYNGTYGTLGQTVGHAWHLATLGAAEYLYKLANDIAHSSEALTITSVSAPFAQDIFLHAVKNARIQPGAILLPSSAASQTFVKGLVRKADAYLRTVQHFTSYPNGSLSEQYHRDSGAPAGARDLTWSYAAFVSCAQARYGHPTL